MNVSFRIRGIDELQRFLRALPRGTVKVVLGAIAEYLIGDEGHGLRHDAGYKYVPRKAAYGQTFQSDKQRRYVMAAIREGRINPGQSNRTGDAARGYHYVETKGGYGVTILNADPGAYYTRLPARQLSKVGWLSAAVVIANNIVGAVRHAQAAVNEYLRRK